MTASIFISFASKDVKVAPTLCSALESRGFPCWISARDIQPGENFQIAIVQALRHAKIMLLVFTANSNTSEEMTKELALASQQKMIVIPLRIEDVAPNDAFAYEFATRQWIDVFADWEQSIDQLCMRIGRALEKTAAAEPAAPLVVTPARAVEAPAPVEPVIAEAIDIVPALQAAPEPRRLDEESLYPKAAPAAAPTRTSGLENDVLEMDPAPRKPRLGKVALLAAAAAIVAVIVIATPALLRAKSDAPRTFVAETPAAAPVLASGQAILAPATLEAQEVLVAEVKAPPKPKRKAVVQEAVAAPTEEIDIPY